MRVARVLTNETCNHNCEFCTSRRPVEVPAFARASAVRERIADAVRAGASEVVLTGGEPTLRRDLAELVAHARATGATRVVLETNAALVDASSAAACRRAGLDTARIHVPAGDAGAADALSRDAGGFAAMWRGAAALAEVGVALEAATPLVRGNRAHVASVPRALAASGLPWRCLVLTVPVSAPSDADLLGAVEAAAALEEIADEARARGLRVRIGGDAPLPPCIHERAGRVAHLYALTPGGAGRRGFERVPACAGCGVRDRCPGVPSVVLARGAFTAHPIADDGLRRRLTVIEGTDEQIARELAASEAVRLSDGTRAAATIVRIHFHCNQSCRFCFVSTHLPPPAQALVEREIRRAAAAGDAVVLSGGEPTLNPRLLDYVRLAKGEGARYVELQTNAVRLGEPGLARSLRDAGVDVAFISLHASSAEVSDAITQAAGTFAKTLVGIDAAVEAGLRVRLNFVFCQQNREDFPGWVRLVAGRWPSAELTVSVIAPSTDVVPRSRELIPRYTDVIEPLRAGLALAAAAGLQVGGFESMCGLPLCLLPEDLRGELAETLPPLATDAEHDEFLRAPACDGCSLRDRCFGVRRGYAELHGTGELQSVRPS